MSPWLYKQQNVLMLFWITWILPSKLLHTRSRLKSSLKKIRPCPKVWYLWMRPYLEKGSLDLEVTLCKFRVGLASNHEYPYKRQGEKRKIYKKIERYRSDVHINQRLIRASLSHCHLEKSQGTDCFSFGASRRNQPCEHLDFRLLVSKLWENKRMLF